MEQQDVTGRSPWRARLPGILLAVLLIGVGIAGLVVALGDRPGSPVVESSDDPGGLVEPDPGPTATAAPTDAPTTSGASSGDDEVVAAWQERDRDGAFAELIRLAEAAGEPPADATLVAAVHGATVQLPSGEDDADEEARLVLSRTRYRWTPDGEVEVTETLLGQADPGDRSLETFRDAYARTAEIDDVSETSGAGDPRDLPSGVAERAVAEAGDRDPRTALAAVHEALQLTWATDELTRWQPALLTVLRDLGPEVVVVEDPLVVLSGRTVVPLAAPWGEAQVDDQVVWFFDAVTGDYAGHGTRGADGWRGITVIERPAPGA